MTATIISLWWLLILCDKNFFFVNVDDYQRVKWVQDLFDEEEY